MGASLNARDNHGMTPLHAAVGSGKKSAVKLLIDAGSDVNSRDNDGVTPLLMATFGLSSEVISAGRASKPIIALLLKRGALPDPTSESSESALFCAVEAQEPDVVEMLLKHGASIQIRDSQDNTVVGMACRLKNEKLLRVLLKYGAAVNAKNKKNLTPLHIVAHNGNLRIAKLLVKNRADLKEKTADGLTAYENRCPRGPQTVSGVSGRSWTKSVPLTASAGAQAGHRFRHS